MTTANRWQSSQSSTSLEAAQTRTWWWTAVVQRLQSDGAAEELHRRMGLGGWWATLGAVTFRKM